MANTQGGQIQQKIDSALRCDKAVALAKARAFGNANRCCKPRTAFTQATAADGQTESTLLEARVACFNQQSPNGSPIPESVRIQRAQQCVLDAERNVSDPTTRFSAQVRQPPLPACPPIDPIFLNASESKPRFGNCPLPNKPFNPVPG